VVGSESAALLNWSAPSSPRYGVLHLMWSTVGTQRLQYVSTETREFGCLDGDLPL